MHFVFKISLYHLEDPVNFLWFTRSNNSVATPLDFDGNDGGNGMHCSAVGVHVTPLQKLCVRGSRVDISCLRTVWYVVG